MDLILCRNVFLYFERETIAGVVAKFCDTLTEGGYLMTGHHELHGQPLGRLHTRVFPEALIYQRSGGHPQPRTSDAAPARVHAVLGSADQGQGLAPKPLMREGSGGGEGSAEVQARTLASPLDEAQALFRNGAYAAAIVKAARVLTDDPRLGRSGLHFEAQYLMAQAYANLGQHAQAARCCGQALSIDPFALQPYYLLAHIAEEQGDLTEAKNCLKKVLYLSPSAIAAYLELAALYEREHDATQARKMRATALALLTALPPHACVEPYAELTAGALVRAVQNEIEGASDA